MLVAPTCKRLHATRPYIHVVAVLVLDVVLDRVVVAFAALTESTGLTGCMVSVVIMVCVVLSVVASRTLAVVVTAHGPCSPQRIRCLKCVQCWALSPLPVLP